MGEVALRSRRRRIIDRPRLIRALDRSGAQVRTLVASAGYGKTTLAEQWSGVPGRRTTWFRARRSAADVAVVARGFAEAAADILPGAGGRMLERLAVTPDPDRDAELLAEMLAVDLATWPSDAWVVVDDYQWVAESRASDAFVGTIVANAPVQLLVAGRTRPSWVTSRDVLYGNVLEIGRAALAMTEEEIDLVLGSARDLAPGLLALAEGWPAVVALSSASTAAEMQVDPEVPEELFDFFADEVFRRLDPAVQDGLCRLAALPVVDEDVAHVALGESVAATVLLEAVDLGIMDAREGRLELHPLAASFLQRRAVDSQPPIEDSVIVGVVDVYRRRGEWDAAFELAHRRGMVDVLEAVLREGVDQLLRFGRLATLESWLQAAADAEVVSPALRVAEAELSLRHGRHFTALTLLEPDLADPPRDEAVAFDVFSTAARAAHIAAKEHDALDYYERALERATTREQRRAAIEGSCAPRPWRCRLPTISSSSSGRRLTEETPPSSSGSLTGRLVSDSALATTRSDQ